MKGLITHVGEDMRDNGGTIQVAFRARTYGVHEGERRRKGVSTSYSTNMCLS